MSGGGGGGGGGGGFKAVKLFGVEIVGHCGDAGDSAEAQELMRKCTSMVNLAGASTVSGAGARESGYLSDGGLVQSSRGQLGRERKRGVPWTVEEHRTFLAGLKKLGKGDWRGISRNFVTTRTPTQVASHAQKYFLRHTNMKKKKRRSSLFDVVMDDRAGSNERTFSLNVPSEEEPKESFNFGGRENEIYVVKHPNPTYSSAFKSMPIQTIDLPHHKPQTVNNNTDLLHPPFLHTLPATAAPDNSSLELSIGPPQLHNLTNFSSCDMISVT